jgi:hypothetical protein
MVEYPPVEVPPDDDHLPLGRRALIRRAAILGAAAWTAPVIIDSLASPASALTVAPLCYRAQFKLSAGVYTRVTPANGGGCTPSPWNNQIDYPGTITLTDTGVTATRWQFTISDPGCVFTIQSQADANNPCESPLGAGTQTITFSGNTSWQGFKLMISCGGVVCA